jgi:pilus assembly protein CpaE
MRVVVTQEQPGPMEPTRQVLLGLGLECSAGDCVPFAELPLRLSQAPADLVLVRIGSAVAIDAVRQAAALTPAPVLATGPTNDVRQVLDTLQGGAREYLDESRLGRDLETALEKLRVSGAVKHGRGLVVGVVSATPGSGVTTVASNLAFTWGEKYPDRVALVELGRETPDLALCLDLEPRYTTAEVAENWQRMDATLLRQSMVGHSAGVQVLAYQPEILEVPALDPQAVRKTVILMRTMFMATVLDLGHILSDEHYEAMRLCDRVAIVVRLDVPGLRQARRLMQLCTEHGVPKERLRPVANRYGQKGQIAWKKAEEALGTKFLEYIPEDSAKLNQALNLGQPLVRASRHANISRRFTKLAHSLNGQLPH